MTITDASGINTTAGTRPRLYFRKGTNTNTFNDNTSGTDGWKYVEATGAGGTVQPLLQIMACSTAVHLPQLTRSTILSSLRTLRPRQTWASALERSPRSRQALTWPRRTSRSRAIAHTYLSHPVKRLGDRRSGRHISEPDGSDRTFQCDKYKRTFGKSDSNDSRRKHW